MKIHFKRRVVLEGGKLIGSFIFFYDKDARPCFKFSIKPKIGSAEMLREDLNTSGRNKLPLALPAATSVDVSYKFADNLLELKTQEPGASPISHFIKAPATPEAFLFCVRIKNWQNLTIVPLKPNTLELKPPTSATNIAIFFSFAGKEGKLFMMDEYLNTVGRTISLTLPNNLLFDKIWVGVVADPDNQEPYDLTIKAPTYKESSITPSAH